MPPHSRMPATRPGLMAGALSNRRGASIGVRAATDGRDMLFNSPDGWEVDQPWLWFDGPAGSDGTGGPWGSPPPGAWRRQGFPAAFRRATSIICDSLAGMPWQVYQGQARLDSPDWVADPQAKRLDQRVVAGPVPDWRKSAVEFRSSLIRSMLWFGEGMIYVPVRNADGSPAPPVWQIHPWTVDVQDGNWVIPPPPGASAWTSETGYTFQPGELIVIRDTAMIGPRGVGVLEEGAGDLESAQQMRQWSLNMFRSGRPPGYLKVTAPQLTQAKATELQRAWMQQHGRGEPKIAVLNATTDFTPLNMDPLTLQLAQLQNNSNLDIALLFGIPPYLLGVSIPGDTYANVTSRLVEVVEFGLLPYARRIESSLDAEFPRGTNMRINLDALRRADTTTRYQAYASALQAGWMTVDEVRAAENMPPMIDGTVTGGSAPGAHAEQAAPATAATAALAAPAAPGPAVAPDVSITPDDSEEIGQ